MVGVDFLAVLVVTNSWWGSTVAATLTRSDTNNLAMDGARDTVLQLEVHLGNGVFWEYGSVRDITNGSRLDHVANGESLDRLVLWSASRAVGAADWLYMTASRFVSAV